MCSNICCRPERTADGEIAYIYVDALGNEIGFAADKRYLQTGDAVIERTEFKDVEGMGLTYRDLTLRDRQGNRLFFDGDGKLIKIESRFSDGIVISYRDGRISAIDAANGKRRNSLIMPGRSCLRSNFRTAPFWNMLTGADC